MKVYPPLIPPTPQNNLPPSQVRVEGIKAYVFGELGGASPKGGVGAAAPPAAAPPVAGPTPPTAPQPMTAQQISTYYFTWAMENLSWMYVYAQSGDTADYQACLSRLQTIAGQTGSGCPPALSAMLTYINGKYPASSMSSFATFWTSGDPTFDDTKNIFKTVTGLSLTNSGLDLCFLNFMGQSDQTTYNFQSITPTETYYLNVFMLAVSLDPNSSASKQYNIDSSFWNPTSPTGSVLAFNFTQSALTALYQLDLTNSDGSPPTAAQLAQYQADYGHLKALVTAVDTALKANTPAGQTCYFDTYVMNDGTIGTFSWPGFKTMDAYFGANPPIWPVHLPSPFISTQYGPPPGSLYYPSDDLPPDNKTPPPATFYDEEQSNYWQNIVNDWDGFFPGPK